VKRRLAVFAASILSLCVGQYDPASATCFGCATPSSDDGFFAPFVGNSNLAVNIPGDAPDFSFEGMSPIPSGGLLGSQIGNDPAPVEDLLGPIITHDPGPVGGLLGPAIMHDPGPSAGFLGPIITYDPGPIGDALGTQFQYDPGTSSPRDLFLEPTPVPATLPLGASALGILGLLSLRRKFITAI
jgi:hypothetical protein